MLHLVTLFTMTSLNEIIEHIGTDIFREKYAGSDENMRVIKSRGYIPRKLHGRIITDYPSISIEVLESLIPAAQKRESA